MFIDSFENYRRINKGHIDLFILSFYFIIRESDTIFSGKKEQVSEYIALLKIKITKLFINMNNKVKNKFW